MKVGHIILEADLSVLEDKHKLRFASVFLWVYIQILKTPNINKQGVSSLVRQANDQYKSGDLVEIARKELSAMAAQHAAGKRTNKSPKKAGQDNLEDDGETENKTVQNDGNVGSMHRNIMKQKSLAHLDSYASGILGGYIGRNEAYDILDEIYKKLRFDSELQHEYEELKQKRKLGLVSKEDKPDHEIQELIAYIIKYDMAAEIYAYLEELLTKRASKTNKLGFNYNLGGSISDFVGGMGDLWDQTYGENKEIIGNYLVEAEPEQGEMFTPDGQPQQQDQKDLFARKQLKPNQRGRGGMLSKQQILRGLQLALDAVNNPDVKQQQQQKAGQEPQADTSNDMFGKNDPYVMSQDPNFRQHAQNDPKLKQIYDFMDDLQNQLKNIPSEHGKKIAAQKAVNFLTTVKEQPYKRFAAGFLANIIKTNVPEYGQNIDTTFTKLGESLHNKPLSDRVLDYETYILSTMVLTECDMVWKDLALKPHVFIVEDKKYIQLKPIFIDSGILLEDAIGATYRVVKHNILLENARKRYRKKKI